MCVLQDLLAGLPTLCTFYVSALDGLQSADTRSNHVDTHHVWGHMVLSNDVFLLWLPSDQVLQYVLLLRGISNEQCLMT